MEKRGRGEHGGRGETKALIILELLKSSYEAIRNGKQEGAKDGIKNTALRVVKTGFIPVRRADLKWNLKQYRISTKKDIELDTEENEADPKVYRISTKSADAIIRALENDK